MHLWTINKIIKWTGFRLIIEGDFIYKPKPIKIYFKFWGWRRRKSQLPKEVQEKNFTYLFEYSRDVSEIKEARRRDKEYGNEKERFE